MTLSLIEFYVPRWTWTLAIGLPIFMVVAVFKWQRAKNSKWWRLILCFLLACIVAPSFFGWSNGHNAAGVIILPAVMAFRTFAIEGEKAEIQPVITYGLIPICIVAALLFGIWARILWKRTPKPKVPEPEPYLGQRCVACREPIGLGVALCPHCGWTQPA